MSATRWLKQEKRSREEILDVFLQAGRGLAAAHEKGIIHRDFKPENMLVGDDGRVRVLDFGLALPVNIEEMTRLTMEDHILGTPAYMSPEQFREFCRSAELAPREEPVLHLEDKDAVGARVTEIPVNHHARQFGQAKYGLSRTVKVFLDIIAVRFIDSKRVSQFQNPFFYPLKLIAGTGKHEYQKKIDH